MRGAFYSRDYFRVEGWTPIRINRHGTKESIQYERFCPTLREYLVVDFGEVSGPATIAGG
jgi:hypothetical protein